jgi:RHH-type proline utilization regulon transcriptional repressor/proline dehydrogenase/delta 1-pyrroline-5-carboxylate dehydrogenase
LAESLLGRLLLSLQNSGTLGPADGNRLGAAFASYERWWNEEFSGEHDHFLLPGQDNIRRYRQVREMRVRLHSDDSPFEVFARVAAARIAGCHVTVSVPPEVKVPVLARLQEATEEWAGAIEFVEETEAELVDAIRRAQCDRIRYADAARVPVEVRRAANEANVYIADAPVLAEGRIELVWYVREQSVSFDYQRYGNLGVRSGEARAEPL